MKRMWVAAMALFSLMMMAVTSPAAMAEDGSSAWPEWTCTTFPGTLAEAQQYFAENGGPAGLDLDGDGIACELGEDYAVGEGGGSAWPDWTCTTFPGSIQDAITQYETYGAPPSLDADGDGSACEPGDDYVAEEDNGPSAWPEWTCTTFPGTVAEAHDYFAENGGPATLDLDGDGVGCELGEDYAVGLGGASAWPDWTCDDFPGGLEAAITQYETYGAPPSLDLDTDGTACEPGEDYTAAEDDGTDNEGASAEEGASADEGTSGDTAVTYASDAPVTSLPVTGTGMSNDGPQAFIKLLALASAALVLAGIVRLNGSHR